MTSPYYQVPEVQQYQVDPQARLQALQSRLSGLNTQSQASGQMMIDAYKKQAQRRQQMVQQQQSGGGGNGYSAPPGQKPTGQVADWINQALGILKLDSSYAPGIAQMIKHESGGNPNAINKWDSNWKAGHPSMGLMQTIQGTFNRWALPGYNQNVYDPVSNIIAGIRYAQNRYGNNMLRAGGRRNKSGNYIGY